MSKVFNILKEYSIITLGIVLFDLGWVIFLVPHQLVGGGVTGIASIIQYATSGAIKMGYSYFVINVILMIIALRVLGMGFGLKTLYAIIIASAGLNVFQDIMPMEIISALALDNGKLMSTIMGGICVGVGIGLNMTQGGSTGGTDIIALIVNKYRNVSPGKMILWMDVVIILSSMLVPVVGADGAYVRIAGKITTVIYGFILVAVVSTVLDMVISGQKQSVQLLILSDKWEELANAITGDLKRGLTVLDGKGWYTKESRHVLMVIARKYDLNILLRCIKSIDPDAFLSVSSITGVYGKGFESIKTGHK